jgi:O-antigen/teichoic acid export membrane protein
VRAFSIEEYGRFAVALTVLTMGSMAAQFGFFQGLVRLIGAYNAKNEKALLRGAIQWAARVPWVAGSLIAVLGAAVVYFGSGGDYLSNREIYFAFAIVPVNAFLLFLQNTARGFGRMVIASFPQQVLLPVSTIFILLLFRDQVENTAQFMALYGIIVFMLVLLVLFLVFRLPEIRELRSISPEYRKKEWILMTFPMLITSIGHQILRRSDLLILSIFVEPALVGMYALASRFAQIISVARYSFNRFWMPSFAGLFATGSIEELQKSVLHVSRLTLFTTVGIVLLLIGGGQVAIRFVTDTPGNTYQLMLILLTGQVAIAVYAPSVPLLEMCGHERLATKLVLPTCLILVLLCFLFSPIGGSHAVATVTATATAMLYFEASRRGRKKIGISSCAFAVAVHEGNR